MRIFSWMLGGLLAWSAAGAEINFDFNESATGAPPTNFLAVLAGSGQPGVWQIITAEVPPLLAPLTDKALVVARHGVFTLDMGPNYDPAAGPIGQLAEVQVNQVKAIRAALRPAAAAARP